MIYINWLVVNPSEKYESQLGWWNSQYMESHKIPWFQTTNQVWYIYLQNWVIFKANVGKYTST